MYIDYANVRYWRAKTHWKIDLKKLKYFLDSFDNIKSIKFYQGTLKNNQKSELEIKKIKNLKYDLITKDVKIMRHSIDVSRIRKDSVVVIEKFLRKNLIRKLDTEAIIFLNNKFAHMNKTGILYIEDRKCNFDVEIGRDMFLDFERNYIDTFVLWSGDCDFEEPIKHLLKSNKKVILFCTRGRVSSELNQLREKGLFIFDINKIKGFIQK